MDPWVTLGIQADTLAAAAQSDSLRRTWTIDCPGPDGKPAPGGVIGFRIAAANAHLFRLGAGPLLAAHYGMPTDSPAGQVPDAGYVHCIAIFPGFQGRGIGPLLLDEAERQTRESCDRITLFVSAFNTRARAFYETRGYCFVGAVDNVLREGNTEHLMLKML